MDRVTLDFEENLIIWDTDSQKGTEMCSDLLKRKPIILAAMGYEQYNGGEICDIVNACVNGEITVEELAKRLDALKPMEE